MEADQVRIAIRMMIGMGMPTAQSRSDLIVASL
jgi:hypothetical protein